MINADAITSNPLIKSDRSASAHTFGTWKRLTADHYASFNNSVFLSEGDSADGNFALPYFLRENSAFSKNIPNTAMLDLHFQCSSVELTCDSMAVAAATPANGSVKPLTGERVFPTDAVKNGLPLMHSCGMYGFSGEFALLIVVPAKSSVRGGIMVVIPKVRGRSVWSPPLGEHRQRKRHRILQPADLEVSVSQRRHRDRLGRRKDPPDAAQGGRRMPVSSTCSGPQPRAIRRKFEDLWHRPPISTAQTMTGEPRCTSLRRNGRQQRCNTSCKAVKKAT